jgi:myo-inositol-1(or 4)-monophosphatase
MTLVNLLVSPYADVPMNRIEQRRALSVAVQAAAQAGALMREHARRPKTVKSSTQHDIKLELDERCQHLIERKLRRAVPSLAVLGEEGVVGEPESEYRWVVDPIDGTVNFAYGIPHACVSIALQEKRKMGENPRRGADREDYESLIGVVYDPFVDEMFTAERGGPARLNGRLIRVSPRGQLGTAIVAVGFSKTRRSLEEMLPVFNSLTHRVRKLRILGAAALSLAYVASGRLDAYVEGRLRLWDIAAGGLLVECAGGCFDRRVVAGPSHTYEIRASNHRLHRALGRLLTW